MSYLYDQNVTVGLCFDSLSTFDWKHLYPAKPALVDQVPFSGQLGLLNVIQFDDLLLFVAKRTVLYWRKIQLKVQFVGRCVFHENIGFIVGIINQKTALLRLNIDDEKPLLTVVDNVVVTPMKY